MVAFDIYRVEDRTSPDGVDFWDFLSDEKANEFIAEMKLEDTKPRKYEIRKLPESEIISTALQFYYNTLG